MLLRVFRFIPICSFRMKAFLPSSRAAPRQEHKREQKRYPCQKRSSSTCPYQYGQTAGPFHSPTIFLDQISQRTPNHCRRPQKQLRHDGFRVCGGEVRGTRPLRRSVPRQFTINADDIGPDYSGEPLNIWCKRESAFAEQMSLAVVGLPCRSSAGKNLHDRDALWGCRCHASAFLPQRLRSRLLCSSLRTRTYS